MALWDSPIDGAGISKAGWDSGLEEGKGNITLCRVDPWTFYPDPNGSSFDDCQYLFEVHKWSLDEIERRFPNVNMTTIEEAVREGDRQINDRSPQKQDFPRFVRDGSRSTSATARSASARRGRAPRSRTSWTWASTFTKPGYTRTLTKKRSHGPDRAQSRTVVYDQVAGGGFHRRGGAAR